MKLEINIETVRNLIKLQFPQWSALPIISVKQSGWDNYSFRLGNNMLIRLPSHHNYAASVKKEQRWLPFLASHLSLQIPNPIALGEPSEYFPLPWSIYRWIEGDTLDSADVTSINQLAISLSNFLKSLHRINTSNGPQPGEENFYRGDALSRYDDQTRQAIKLLKNKIDAKNAIQIWEAALSNSWEHKAVWVHGDISMGNILIKNGNLTAIIDFGQTCVGDPACDLVPYWTFLINEAADIFKEAMHLDEQTWQRARGWALWKFLIVESRISPWNKFEGRYSKEILDRVLNNE